LCIYNGYETGFLNGSNSMSEIKNNPLSSYFRQAKYYTPLPSGGRWYEPGSIDWPATGEVGIMPMTAKDEISLKTPDALLNGQGTVDIIQSCVPAIKNAWNIPSVDLDTLLIAIRIATYGSMMDVSPDCPQCKAVNNYQLDLKEAQAQTLHRVWNDYIHANELTIVLKPMTYRQLNNKQYRTFEEQRLLQEIQQSSLDEATKIKKFSEGFKKLTSLTLEIVLDSIACIQTPDGTQVTDRSMIEDFIQNTSSDVFDSINKCITNNKESFSLAPIQVECQECQHKWKQELEFDATNFFARGSSN